MRRQTSAHTQTCKRLVKEWSFYVSKSKCLSKVFVSIKGVYFQAEVMGQPVTWVTPHMFTTRYPRDVDFSIMLTFLEFYETLLKFAMFKLFHTLDLRYPPALDADLDGADAGLSTLKTQSLEGGEGAGEAEGQPDGEEPEGEDEEEHRVLPSTKEERREAKRKLKEEEKKLKSLEAKLGQISRADKAAAAAAAAATGSEATEGGGQGDEDAEMGEAMTVPLEEAFMSRTEEGEDILADDGAGGEEERRKRLFKGLKFFFGREVPKSWLELVVSSCGGVVGWEGEGSPFSSADPGITHQIVDRPTMTEPRRKRREYVQPQWVLDSLNARVLLPVARYAPGAALPPHLSPFVDDEAEGYVPAYREELDKLRSAAEARRKSGAAPGGEEEEGEGDGVVDVVAGVATDVSASKGGSKDEEEEAEEEEEAFVKDLERERAGTTFSKAKELEEGESDSDSGDDSEEDGDSSSDEEEEEGDEDGEGSAGGLEEVAPAATEKQTEDQEHHELSRNMMSKKAKRLYGRMQHGLSKRREEVDRLKAKRKKLESQYDAAPGMAKKSKTKASSRKNKKRRASSATDGD
ncbi:unnamed protein product [Scytosiphon promiscuus]